MPGTSFQWSSLFAARCVAVAAAAFALTVCGCSGGTAPGRIIRQDGEWVSPSGTYVAWLHPYEGDRWRVDIKENAKGGRLITQQTQAAPEEWFAAWDEQDRLWLYVGEKSVRIFDPVGESAQVALVPSLWQGIPATFLAELPKDMADDYEAWNARRKDK